jgi:hypothetical protein
VIIVLFFKQVVLPLFPLVASLIGTLAVTPIHWAQSSKTRRLQALPFSPAARKPKEKLWIKGLVLLTMLSVLICVCLAGLAVATSQVVPLESFEEYPLLAFPGQWRVRGDVDQARLIYQVTEENGDRFLHAHADQQAIQIGIVHVCQPREFPLLRWRWRVTELPPGGDEHRKETHDSAAGVYVIFDNRIFPRVIKYVWSATVPVGTRLQNPLYWRAKIIVLRSGSSGLGEWRHETVNFYQDYRELFGAEPGQVQGIGLMTSSSFTKSVTVADYDDFLLLNPEALPAEEEQKLHELYRGEE